MTSMREDLERKLHHQQPRMRCDFTTPGFVHPDPQPCPNPDCQGGRIDSTPAAAIDPALQSDTECPDCNGSGQATR